MSFEQLLNSLTGSLSADLAAFAPELVLCATIVALLLGRLTNLDRVIPGYWGALIGSLIAFGLAYMQVVPGDLPSGDSPFFSGLLVNDGLTVFFRLFLLLFLILVIALTVLSGVPDFEDGPDFYTLLLGATVGMMLMASANHLLMLFLAVEMASVPSYVMVGFLKGRRLSSEASLKYVVYGAGAAGVMLYGTSLVGGMLGTAELPLVAEQLGHLLATDTTSEGMSHPAIRTVMLGLMMVLVGLAFKLSLVPFHFWCPDAFEGAPAEVGGFLSVASKGAAFALLIRVATQFVGVAEGDQLGPADDVTQLYVTLGVGLGVISAVTMTFGNLAAYFQTNVKRLLAYSTIAHAGFMLAGVAAMVIAHNSGASPGTEAATQAKQLAADCVEGVLFYLAVYLFMNLGAFAIVALIRNQTYSEEIDDYRGLWSQTPLLCVAMAICLFSLVGLPPLGGFMAKFFVLAATWQAGDIHPAMWGLVVVALMNTVISLFYYLRVLVAMFIAPRPEEAPTVQSIPAESAYILLVTVPIVLLGASPLIGRLSDAAQSIANNLFKITG